ncbi:MAG: OadG family protein [Bacteroidota bacterium]
MSPEIATAFTVLWVGMITVFVILSLVVVSGQLLIRIINRYFPVVSDPPVNSTAPSKESTVIKVPSPNPAQIAAITAAVDLLTKGKGQVSRIEKVEP